MAPGDGAGWAGLSRPEAERRVLPADFLPIESVFCAAGGMGKRKGNRLRIQKMEYFDEKHWKPLVDVQYISIVFYFLYKICTK